MPEAEVEQALLHLGILKRLVRHGIQPLHARSADMPAGPTTPMKPSNAKPGTVSPTVGTSGSAGERFAPDTAIGRSRLAWM